MPGLHRDYRRRHLTCGHPIRRGPTSERVSATWTRSRKKQVIRQVPLPTESVIVRPLTDPGDRPKRLRTAEGDRVFIQIPDESQDSFLSLEPFRRAPYSHVARVGSDMEPCAVRPLSWKSNDVSIIGPGIDSALFMPHPRALVPLTRRRPSARSGLPRTARARGDRGHPLLR